MHGYNYNRTTVLEIDLSGESIKYSCQKQKGGGGEIMHSSGFFPTGKGHQVKKDVSNEHYI